MKTSQLIAILMLLLAPQLAAQPELNLLPQTCILDDSGVCHTQLQLSFYDTAAPAICVVIPGASVRQCYPAAEQQQISLTITTRQALNVEIIDANSGEQLATAAMTLATYSPPTRKRRRFSWSY